MKGGDLVIREMVEADIPSLLRIEQVSFPVPWTAGIFLTQLQLADRACNLVALRGGRIVGYVSSWYGYEETHVLSIAVEPEERGGWAASLLLSRAESMAQERGCLKAVLEVRVSNERALGFYEKHGYRVVGRRKRYYADSGEDALILERVIGAVGGT